MRRNGERVFGGDKMNKCCEDTKNKCIKICNRFQKDNMAQARKNERLPIKKFTSKFTKNCIVASLVSSAYAALMLADEIVKEIK